MTIPRILLSLVVAATTSAFAGESPAGPASTPSSLRSSAEATKARQEADRQRLIAKLRADAPKSAEKPKGTVLDLPIFNRHNAP